MPPPLAEADATAMSRVPRAPSDSEPTDEALMLAAKAGDSASFALLASRYATRLVAYCMRFTRDAAAAEEVAQETWLSIWSARKTYEPKARFVVLLFTAARNRCKNLHRGALRAVTALGRPSETDVDWLASAAPTGLDSILATERRARLAAHVDQLSPALRETLVLRVVDELSYADVGAILEIPEATARTRVHLAVQKLRELGRREAS